MTAKMIPTKDLIDVVNSLSNLAASQVATLILQQPTLPRVIVATLRSLTREVLSNGGSKTPTKPFEAVVKILEEAAQSSDPSLARRLIPTPDSILNLAILAASSTNQNLDARIRALVPQLIDRYAADDVLIAAAQAVKESLSQGNSTVYRSVRIASALLQFLPASPAQGAQKSAREKERKSCIDELTGSIRDAYEELRPSEVQNDQPDVLATKVALLDCAFNHLARVTAEGDVDRLADLILKLAGIFKDEGPVESPLQLPLLADVTLARRQLYDSTKNLLSSHTSSPSSQEGRTEALKALEKAQGLAQKCTSKSFASGNKTDLASISPSWLAVTTYYKVKQNNAANSYSNAIDHVSTPASQANPQIPASLLGLVEAILPHLAAKKAKLQTILAKPEYRGRSDEEVVQMLLEEQETDAEAPQRSRSPLASAAAQVPSAPRANIFDDQPLDSSRLRWAGGRDETDAKTPAPLSPTMRSAILARVQAQQAEESQVGEEWNPFAEEDAATRGREVGFEEELEEEDDERLNRRQAISNIGGSKGNARDWVRRLEDYETSSTAGEDSDQEMATREDKGASSASPSSASAVAKERAAERVLIQAYAEHGPSLFEKTPEKRKSEARRTLKTDLERVSGRVYDDALVESWGTMFGRNVSTT